ncbi:MAG: hypothetical protein JO150_03640 [Acidobacteriaceae bacterium]|nr:hypothetical protein [Acidobacteriaceae bacterium]
MPLETKILTRHFVYNGVKLPDPNSAWEVEGR